MLTIYGNHFFHCVDESCHLLHTDNALSLACVMQHLKDKFWNFIFYKFIFIFGVLNVQTVEEVVMWCLWFAALIFLHLMVQLCKDRFEYVSYARHRMRLV